MFFGLFKQISHQFYKTWIHTVDHNRLLKKRLIAKRSELAILKHQSRAYVRLRVLAKEIVCHGAHVSYSGAKTVKIKISRQLHDKLLATIEDIEDKKIWIG